MKGSTALRLILIIPAVGLLLLWLGWQALLLTSGIQHLDWQGLQLDAQGLSLQRLDIRRQTDGMAQAQTLSLRQLRWEPLSWWQPGRTRRLQITSLSVGLHEAPEPGQTTTGMPVIALATLGQGLDWLPETLQIEDFELQLPCARASTCRLRGQLHARHNSEQSASRLQLIGPDQHALTLNLQARMQGPESFYLHSQLSLDDRASLEAHNWLSEQDRQLNWRGTLTLLQLPLSPWLRNWLQDWIEEPLPDLPPRPESLQLGASWNLDLPEGRVDLQQLQGGLSLALQVPSPWPIGNYGQLSGTLNLDIQRQQSQWQLQQLKGDLAWIPANRLLASIPQPLRPERIRLQLTQAQALSLQDPQQLQADARVKGEGPNQWQLAAPGLQLKLDPLQLELPQALLELSQPALDIASIQARDLRLHSRFQAHFNADNLQLHLQQAQLETGRLRVPKAELQLQGLQLKLGSTRFNAAPSELQSLALELPVELQLRHLQHPHLQPQDWSWQGQLQASRGHYSLDGQLGNDSGLALSIHSSGTGQQQTMDLQLDPVDFARGNPLARTLRRWPETLELNRGTLNVEGHGLWRARPGQLTGQLQLQARQVDGIQNRTEIHGLEAQTKLELMPDRLRLDLQPFKIDRLNPGIDLGPLEVRGYYQAALEHPLTGQLRWQSLQLQAFGGRIWSDATTLDLGHTRQALDIQLRDLQLASILEAYPLEGLSGTGILDGSLQLQRSQQQLSAPTGSLKARYPGVLKFSSASMQALAGSNPAMSLVAQSLENFQYDLLSSALEYAEDGTLSLGLKLHGRNPDLQGGRAIHFNINLQENIPDLLTSLQLSDRVSETIQKRVRKSLQDNPAIPAQETAP